MIYSIGNDCLSVSVKSHGAELTSVRSEDTGYEYLWQGDPAIWYGQSPVLFPIVGRLLDDRYSVNGTEYSMPKHGLFRKREADLVYRDAQTLIFRQEQDEETLKQYPYKFQLFIRFTLSGARLIVNHRVVNTNESDMYFALGAHPAFNLKIGDKLKFSCKETLFTERIDTDAYRLPGRLPVLCDEDELTITEHLFDNDALIMNGVKSGKITLSNSDGRTVEFYTGNPPYLGIWAKPGAPYVCIEPWWGVNDDRVRRDDFSQKDEIIRIAPQSDWNACWYADFS